MAELQRVRFDGHKLIIGDPAAIFYNIKEINLLIHDVNSGKLSTMIGEENLIVDDIQDFMDRFLTYLSSAKYDPIVPAISFSYFTLGSHKFFINYESYLYVVVEENNDNPRIKIKFKTGPRYIFVPNIELATQIVNTISNV
jgi:hypothetical protein